MQISNQQLVHVLNHGEKYIFIDEHGEQCMRYTAPTRYTQAAARLIVKLWQDNVNLSQNSVRASQLLAEAFQDCETLRTELKNALDSKYQQSGGTVSCIEP